MESGGMTITILPPAYGKNVVFSQNIEDVSLKFHPKCEVLKLINQKISKFHFTYYILTQHNECHY